MGPRKCSIFCNALFNCLLFCSFINITSSNMASKAKRDQIVALKTAAITNHEITKHLDVSRKTLFNVWTQYTETATTSNMPITGRKRSIRIKPILPTVMKRVKRNLRRTIRKTARDFKIIYNRTSKNDVRLTAYKKQSRQVTFSSFQTDTTSQGKNVLAEMQRAVDHVFVWSDEQIFTMEAVTNKQNDKTVCT